MNDTRYDPRLHDAGYDARILSATRRGKIKWSAGGLNHWRSLHDVARQMARQFPGNRQWQHNRAHASNMIEAIEFQQRADTSA